ncbi:MAG: hypothetical protein ACLTU3_15680 [Acutalibacteraceae bacterium]
MPDTSDSVFSGAAVSFADGDADGLAAFGVSAAFICGEADAAAEGDTSGSAAVPPVHPAKPAPRTSAKTTAITFFISTHSYCLSFLFYRGKEIPQVCQAI